MQKKSTCGKPYGCIGWPEMLGKHKNLMVDPCWSWLFPLELSHHCLGKSNILRRFGTNYRIVPPHQNGQKKQASHCSLQSSLSFSVVTPGSNHFQSIQTFFSLDTSAQGYRLQFHHVKNITRGRCLLGDGGLLHLCLSLAGADCTGGRWSGRD